MGCLVSLHCVSCIVCGSSVDPMGHPLNFQMPAVRNPSNPRPKPDDSTKIVGRCSAHPEIPNTHETTRYRDQYACRASDRGRSHRNVSIPATSHTNPTAISRQSHSRIPKYQTTSRVEIVAPRACKRSELKFGGRTAILRRISPQNREATLPTRT